MAFTSLRLHQHLCSPLPFTHAPTVSLTLSLVLFFFSVYVSSPLLFSATDSLVLISLPHLWKRFLTWLTLPYLFLVLNSIIILLSLTAGIFRRSSSGLGDRNNKEEDGGLEKQQIWSCFSPRLVVKQFSVSPWRKRMQVSMHAVSSMDDTPGTSRPCRQEIALENDDAHEGAGFRNRRNFQKRESWQALRQPNFKEENLQSNAEERKEDSYDDILYEASTVSTEQMKVVEGASAKDEVQMATSVKRGNSEPSSPVVVTPAAKGGESEPYSPHFVTPAKSIKRSFSFDSARSPLLEQQLRHHVSEQELSDEAFRRRVDDFISRMNARFKEI